MEDTNAGNCNVRGLFMAVDYFAYFGIIKGINE